MRKILIFILFTTGYCRGWKSQTINYVSNGSFEECVNCTQQPYYLRPANWTAIDSVSFSFVYCSAAPPISNLPYMSTGFQQPRSGKSLALSTFFCDLSTCTYTNSRGYAKNILIGKLKSNTVYCATYHVVNTNNCIIGMDAYGMYFSDSSIDTIKYCNVPLTYLTPQVKNAVGNIITDTLLWTAITGTFIASGTESFMVLGNFNSNQNTNTVVINPMFLPSKATDVYIDDVSCIELNAPAYAGPDQAFKMGDSLYLGSPRDFAVDELCRWYQLPGNIALDTAAGIWVKPTETSTYVVRQEICGLVKWDTVVVFKDAVGLEEDQTVSALSLYPNPFSDQITFKPNSTIYNGKNKLVIYDQLGLMVREEELFVKNQSASINLSALRPGLYLLQIENPNGRVSKRITKCE